MLVGVSQVSLRSNLCTALGAPNTSSPLLTWDYMDLRAGTRLFNLYRHRYSDLMSMRCSSQPLARELQNSGTVSTGWSVIMSDKSFHLRLSLNINRETKCWVTVPIDKRLCNRKQSLTQSFTTFELTRLRWMSSSWTRIGIRIFRDRSVTQNVV